MSEIAMIAPRVRPQQRLRRNGRMARRSRAFLETLESRLAPAVTNVVSTSLPTVVNTAGSALSFNGSNDYLITPNLQELVFHDFGDGGALVQGQWSGSHPGRVGSDHGSIRAWHDSQIEILSNGQVDARVWDLSPVSLGTASFGDVELRGPALRQQHLDPGRPAQRRPQLDDGDRHPHHAPQRRHGLYYAFGATDSTNMGSGAWFNGSIDDVSIWNVARSNSADPGRHGQPPIAAQTGLVADYQLDDGTRPDGGRFVGQQLHRQSRRRNRRQRTRLGHQQRPHRRRRLDRHGQHADRHRPLRGDVQPAARRHVRHRGATTTA